MAEATSTITETATPVWLSVCGKLAPISTVLLYLAPIPTVLEFSRKKELGDLPLAPYTSMLSNGFIWTVYGLMNSIPSLYTASTSGAILGSFYFIAYARLLLQSHGRSASLPGSLNQHIQVVVAIVAFTLYFVKNNKAAPIGKLGLFINIAMYASPLAAIQAVIKSKSAKAIPLSLTVVSLLSCIFWTGTAYFELHEPYIYVPTTLGIIFGLMQVALKIIYKESSSRGQRKNKLSPLLHSREAILRKR